MSLCSTPIFFFLQNIHKVNNSYTHYVANTCSLTLFYYDNNFYFTKFATDKTLLIEYIVVIYECAHVACVYCIAELPKNTLTHCQAHSRGRLTEKAPSCMVDCESLSLMFIYTIFVFSYKFKHKKNIV